MKQKLDQTLVLGLPLPAIRSTIFLIFNQSCQTTRIILIIFNLRKKFSRKQKYMNFIINIPFIFQNSYLKQKTNIKKVFKNFNVSIKFSLQDFLSDQKQSFKNFLLYGLIQELDLHGFFSTRNDCPIQQMHFSKNKNFALPIPNCNWMDVIFHSKYYKLKKPRLSPKQAVLKRQTYNSQLFVPIEFILYPNKEVFIDWFLLAHLPMMTKNGHFIVNGSPRLILNQIIRRPGIYFKEIKKNDNSIYVADFIAQRGTWLRLEIDAKNKLPYTRKIWAKIKRLKKCDVSLVLSDLGLNQVFFDQHLKNTQMLTRFKNEPIFKNTFLNRNEQIEEFLDLNQLWAPNSNKVQSYFRSKFANPYVYSLSQSGRIHLNQTLGLNLPINQTTLTGEDILLGCVQLINFFYGSQKNSDIDDLKNRKIQPSGELIQSQIGIGLKRLTDECVAKLNQSFENQTKTNINACGQKNIKSSIQIFDSTYSQKKVYFKSLISNVSVNNVLKDFFGTNPLSQFLDQTNPLAELTHKRRVSSLGEGGVNRDNATMAIRGIHPSHYGRICPIETPEGQNAGLVNSFTTYAKLNSLGLVETPYFPVYKGMVIKEFSPMMVSSAQEKNFIIAPGDVSIDRFDCFRNKKLSARQDKNFSQCLANQIDLMAVEPVQMISVATSLIPFLEHDDGNRALMGSNMQRQAVPTLIPSAAIVKTGFESKIVSDSVSNIQAKTGGYVSYVDNQTIKILTFKKSDASNLCTAGIFDSKVYPKFKPCGQKLFSNQILKNLEIGNFCFHQNKNVNKRFQKFCSKSYRRFVYANNIKTNNYARKIDTFYFSNKHLISNLNQKFGQNFSINFDHHDKILNSQSIKNKNVVLSLCDQNYPSIIKINYKKFNFNNQQINSLLDYNNHYERLSLINIFYNLNKTVLINQSLTFSILLSQTTIKVLNQTLCETWLVYRCVLMLNQIFLWNYLKSFINNIASCFIIQSNQNFDQTNINKIKNLNSPALKNFQTLNLKALNSKTLKILNKSELSDCLTITSAFNQKLNSTLIPFSFQTIFFQNFLMSRYSNNIKTYIQYLLNKNSKKTETKTLTNIKKYFSKTSTYNTFFQKSGLLKKIFKPNYKHYIEIKTFYNQLGFKILFSLFQVNRKNKFSFEIKKLFENSLNKITTEKTRILTQDSFSLKKTLFQNFNLNQNKQNNYLFQMKSRFSTSFQSFINTKNNKAFNNINFNNQQNKINIKCSMTLFDKQLMFNNLTIKPFKFNVNLNLINAYYTLDPFLKSNQDTTIKHRPSVIPGQWIEKGDLLAENQASSNGELAIGQNLMIGYMPWQGYNFEDAVLLSQTCCAQDLLTTLHIERYEISIKDTPYGREETTCQLPKKSEKRQPHLDETGVVKVGTWIKPGDLLVGKVTPVGDFELSSYETLVYDIVGRPQAKVRDSSLRVPKTVHGRVIHVERITANKSNDSKKSKDSKHSNFNTAADPLNASKNKKRKKRKKNVSINSNTSVSYKAYVKTFRKKFKTCFKKPDFNLKKSNTLKLLKKPKSSFSSKLLRFRFKNLVKNSRYKSFFKNFYFSKNQLKLKKRFNSVNKTNVLNLTYFNVSNTLNKLLLWTNKANKINAINFNFNFNFNSKKVLNKIIKFLYFEDMFHANQIKTRNCVYAKQMFQDMSKNMFQELLHSFGQKKLNLNKYDYNDFKLKSIKKPLTKIEIYVAEPRKIQVGDKIAGRHGNKGIVSAILPREDMPYLPDGHILDLVLNPLGVPSRMNVGQIFECLLGLAGSYLKQTYKISGFDEIYGLETSRSLVYTKLYEASLKSNQSWLFNPNNPGKVKLFDGRTGDCFEQPVSVGKAYILKLIHLVDEKMHARSSGPYSLVTQQPLRGKSSQGGQRVGEMEVWAFEGFGAAYLLQELLTIKSDDIINRENVIYSILNNQPFQYGTPESFNVLMSELQCLCLNVKLNHQKANLKQIDRKSKSESYWLSKLKNFDFNVSKHWPFNQL